MNTVKLYQCCRTKYMSHSCKVTFPEYSEENKMKTIAENMTHNGVRKQRFNLRFVRVPGYNAKIIIETVI